MSKPVGFWGLVLTSNSPFTHVASRDFTITMAAFDSKLKDDKRTSVLMARNDSTKYVLCNLIPGVIEQQILNQTIFSGETVTIHVEGKNKIHLTGHYVEFLDTLGNGQSSGQTIIDEHFQSNILPNHSNIMSSASKVDGKTKNNNGSGDGSGSSDKNESGGNVRGNGKLKRSIDTLNSNDSSIANHNADNDNDNDGNDVANKSKTKRKNVKKNDKKTVSSDNNNNNSNKNKDDKDVEVINGEKKQVKKRKTNSGDKNVTIEDDGGDAKMDLDSVLDDLDDDNDNQDKNSDTNEKAINNNQKINKKKTQIKQQQENPTNQVNNKKESPEEKQANNNKNKNKKKDTKSNSKTNEEKNEAGLPKSPKPSNDKSPNSQEKKVKNVGGVSITEAKVGMGKQAKNGKKVGVRYIGRLKENGKVFDSNTTGRPFFFTLGKAEVIKGWDIGINGMCVGGERKLVIPPALAYGTKGDPPTIPKGATLEFEVKLLQVD